MKTWKFKNNYGQSATVTLETENRRELLETQRTIFKTYAQESFTLDSLNANRPVFFSEFATVLKNLILVMPATNALIKGP